MHVLVLGGTRFVGRHVVNAALEAGHEVTLFNRGLTNPELYPDVEKLRGDRGDDLSAIAGREFDTVLDIAGYLPRHVRRSTEELRSLTGFYVFVSSISVYSDFSPIGIDEDAPLEQLEDETSEDIGRDYGALKVRCEEIVQSAFVDDSLIVRPGLIVGPHDHTNRFTYWVTRMECGGRVLAPAPPERPVQYVDARDLAAWMIEMTEQRSGGVFNAVCPPFPMADLLGECSRVAGSDALIEWVEEDFLLSQDVSPWEELPLWLPGRDDAGSLSVDASKAAASGLRSRPSAETAEDILLWASSLNELPGTAGLPIEKEEQLLRAWDALRAP